MHQQDISELIEQRGRSERPVFGVRDLLHVMVSGLIGSVFYLGFNSEFGSDFGISVGVTVFAAVYGLMLDQRGRS